MGAGVDFAPFLFAHSDFSSYLCTWIWFLGAISETFW